MSTSKPWLSHRRLAQRLTILLGRWRLEGTYVGEGGPQPIAGTTTIRWLVKDALAVMRTRMRGGPMGITAVLGADDANNCYSMQYTDTRGVTRQYVMTLTARRWTLFRRARGFRQRFTGRIAPGGRTIRATWDLSADGRRWVRDLNLVYRKRRQAE